MRNEYWIEHHNQEIYHVLGNTYRLLSLIEYSRIRVTTWFTDKDTSCRKMTRLEVKLRGYKCK